MIGDIVAYADGEQHTITDVRKIDGQCGVVCLKQKNGHTFNAVIELLRPVPLSKEFLVKNNFEIQDQGGERADVWTGFSHDCEGDIEIEFQNDEPTRLKIDGVFKGEYYRSINIKFVHQFQHALRNCGINKTITLP